MLHSVESSKSFYEVTLELTAVIPRLGFVILQSHDLGEILRARDIAFDDEYAVFDICNYRYLERTLAIDLQLATAWPWRIAVFTDNGATRIALMRPSALLAALSEAPELVRLAAEIEEKLVHIVVELR